MSTQMIEEMRGVEELREAYEKALDEERALVTEIRALSTDEEEAVSKADAAMITDVARRRLELPMHLTVVMRKRARLLLQVAEAEFEEASAERQQAREKVTRVEQAYRRASQKLEEERSAYAGADGEYIDAREQLNRAREGLNNVLAMDSASIVQRLAKEGGNG